VEAGWGGRWAGVCWWWGFGFFLVDGWVSF